MTAWQVGYGGDKPQSLGPSDGGLGAYVGKVIEWIPADVVALYAVVVTSLQATDTDPGGNPSKFWLVVFVVLAPVVAWLGALTAKRPFTWRDLGAGLLALGAFAIWSTSVPQSGWGANDWVRENPTQLAIGAAVAGLVYSLLAIAINARIPTTPIKRPK